MPPRLQVVLSCIEDRYNRNRGGPFFVMASFNGYAAEDGVIVASFSGDPLKDATTKDFNVVYVTLIFLPIVRDTEAQELSELEVAPALTLLIRTYRVIEAEVSINLG